MLSKNIESEFDRHIKKLRSFVIEEFEHEIISEIANKSTGGVLPKEMEDPVYRTKMLFDLIESDYNVQLREIIEHIKELFARHKISFRLVDIDECLHGFRRLTLLWSKNSYEYILDCEFGFTDEDGDENETPDSVYKLGQISRGGTPIKGDIVTNSSVRYFSENEDLPDWFVSALRADT